MSNFHRSLLMMLAVFAAPSDAPAAGKPPRRSAAHHIGKPPRHIAHTHTNHYRRPAVHRRPVQTARHVNRNLRRPATRTVVRTVRRYPVHRVVRRHVYRPYYYHRNYRHHRRYTYTYFPGRYLWRSSYYNRGYGRSLRHFSRGIRGIVESVQGNAGNGTLVVNVFRPRVSRFRYGPTFVNANPGRRVSSLQRFHVNNATRYEIMSAPRRAGTFAALRKGDQVLLLRQVNRSNSVQRIELFPRRRR